MSNPSRACKSDFDYKVYNDSGVKIPVSRSSLKMAKEAVDEKRMLELRIFDDIKNVYDTYVDINHLETVEDLSEVLEEISLLCKQYRHVHSV